MQRQDHGELIKTEAGKRRIAAASERLDHTVAEMGQQHRADLPQGENAPVMGQNQPTAVETPPDFIPIPSRDIIDVPPMEKDESREVPPPADEPGVGETHDAVESREEAGPGRDIDVIDDDHTDLDSLMAVLTKDARKEIMEANDDIMGVIRA